MHPTINQLCQAYFNASQQAPFSIPYWHFCDNQADADDCARLVVEGVKRATSPSLWWHEAHNEPIAKAGDLHVVTNWQGEAQCIIQTTRVAIVPFNQITAEYAALEGEGDKSLAYWKQVHWAYYQRELAETGFTPTLEMPIVCTEFNVVLARTQSVLA
ncbi:ASCH domain-containing protein [Aestuariibacter sp. AA17]|uniref:ASCH domain-containing protein n=1 Tax=Fluctibacter corallii TaxID=2984329 RepID=A0ABT3ACD3_9ALTE|nr:ASCH domain-containing protein [Aestuariibacter sp. AA17]MCV2886332.1 ASCH domain-containing protein [Aestuariibacter sp. AA17]